MLRSSLTELLDWIQEVKHELQTLGSLLGLLAQLVFGIDTQRDLQAEAPEPTDHAHDFESVSFTIDKPLDGDRLQAFFETLPEALLRAKGVLNLVEKPDRRTIYQRVGARWNYTTGEPWGDVQPHSSLAFIGPAGQLDGPTLETRLLACQANRSDAVKMT